MRIVVLGIGNILMTDEGIGPHAVNALQQRYALPDEVEVVDGGTAGMELIRYVSNADHLIVVDAVRVGQPPASVVKMTGDAVPAFFRTKLSPHQVGLSDLLATLMILGESPGTITLVGVQPDSFDMNMDLSPAVAAKLDTVVEMIADELRGFGVVFDKAA
jgi:hydrogenase maturation protease